MDEWGIAGTAFEKKEGEGMSRQRDKWVTRVIAWMLSFAMAVSLVVIPSDKTEAAAETTEEKKELEGELEIVTNANEQTYNAVNEILEQFMKEEAPKQLEMVQNLYKTYGVRVSERNRM